MHALKRTPYDQRWSWRSPATVTYAGQSSTTTAKRRIRWYIAAMKYTVLTSSPSLGKVYLWILILNDIQLEWVFSIYFDVIFSYFAIFCGKHFAFEIFHKCINILYFTNNSLRNNHKLEITILGINLNEDVR